jgi:sporulation protein YlmC with PRC-barrel domain
MATASAIALLVAMPAGFAQTTPSPTTTPRTQNQPAMPPTGGAASTTQAPGQVDAQKLIGRNVVNAQNETVGEIESLMVDQDGKIRSAVLGVGGFLGIGERHVAVSWDQLSVAPSGDRVTVNMTRDQARALPEFRYSDTQRRGSVFSDMGTNRGTTTGAMSGSSDTRTGTVGTTSGMTGTGHALSASNLIGLNLRNSANETIGEVKDIVLGADGKVSDVIVGVGGFLGMGERYVAISWDQLRMTRANDSRVQGEVGYTRDQLREMPTWRQDRDGWVRG